MRNSILPDLQGPVAFACHDAGAANLIFSWLAKDSESRSDTAGRRLLAEGPAARLWSDYNVPRITLCDTLDSLLEPAQTIVTGTGWASKLEFEALRLARHQGIYTIAVIDHWTNYRERFERDGDTLRPDEIWVADSDAMTLAQTEFENLRIRQLPNTYLDNAVQQIQAHEHVYTVGNRLLYLLEPVRDAWGKNVSSGEFAALDFFVDNIDRIGLEAPSMIRLRPHPSDPIGKYDAWINNQTNMDIALDESPSLAASIAWSDTVVGCQTYAMVIALAAGRKVFSSVPPWAPACILPQTGIIRLSDPESTG